jgi:putative endonuclease
VETAHKRLPSFPHSISSYPRRRVSRFLGMVKQFYVYILASKRNGTLYVGVTSDLTKRVWEHKSKLVKGFTEQYGVDKLVYYEVHSDAENAILREKQIKKWNRSWKLRLIEEKNPDWKDLFDDIKT